MTVAVVVRCRVAALVHPEPPHPELPTRHPVDLAAEVEAGQRLVVQAPVVGRGLPRPRLPDVRLDGTETTSSSPAEPATYRASSLRRHWRPNWITTHPRYADSNPVPLRASRKRLLSGSITRLITATEKRPE